MYVKIGGMPKKINYQLDEQQVQAVEEAQKHGASAQIRLRATGIRLLHQGRKPNEVAEILNVAPATVYNWHEHFREKGVASLGDKPRSGRPLSATPEYCQALEQALQSDPSELGYDFTIWTISRLLAHLQKVTQILLSDDTLRALLARQEYVYRRPKHDLRHLQDAEKRQTAEEWLDLLKKKSQSRRNPTTLYGRKHPDLASRSAQVLDETRQTTSHPGGRSTETSSPLRRL